MPSFLKAWRRWNKGYLAHQQHLRSQKDECWNIAEKIHAANNGPVTVNVPTRSVRLFFPVNDSFISC